jgi:hypothetical protein
MRGGRQQEVGDLGQAASRSTPRDISAREFHELGTCDEFKGIVLLTAIS